ncbi:MATE efflux family protein [Lactifluus subvellereus]|nr:MATE efflux family protein [Lactifluus subvellereus]
MNESSSLLPALSRPLTSSVSVLQPVLADGTDDGSRLLEAAAPPRPRGWREITALCRDSAPVIFSYTLQHSIHATAIVIAGRLGPKELTLAGFSLMLAFADTLGSQAFTGGKHSTDLSVHFQRCFIMLCLLFVPVGIAWANIAPILMALGQEEELSQGTQDYLRPLLLAAPGYIGFESLKKYLQCQGIMDASTHRLAIALSLTYWLAFLFLIMYTAWSPTHTRNQTWGGLQLRATLDPRSCVTFLKLALPGILMVESEWVAFEIVALIAARLGSVPRAAQAAIMTTDQVLNTIPFGIGVAASTRVGNAIGRRDAAGAKFIGHLSALLSALAGAVVMFSLLASKNVFGYLFSEDESVVKLVAEVMPLVASFQVADGLAGSCGGVLRGLGRQHLGAAFNILAYYILALPLGVILAFRAGYGLQGLWMGQVVALFIVGACEYVVVWLGTDWDYEVEQGNLRNNPEVYDEVTEVYA